MTSDELFGRFRTNTTRAIVVGDDVYLNVTDVIGTMQLFRLELEELLGDKVTVPSDVPLFLIDGILKLLVASQSPTVIE